MIYYLFFRICIILLCALGAGVGPAGVFGAFVCDGVARPVFWPEHARAVDSAAGRATCTQGKNIQIISKEMRKKNNICMLSSLSSLLPFLLSSCTFVCGGGAESFGTLYARAVCTHTMKI